MLLRIEERELEAGLTGPERPDRLRFFCVVVALSASPQLAID